MKGGEGFEAQVGGERGEARLARAEPLTAEIERRGSDRLAERAAPHALARFEDAHRKAAPGEESRRREPREPGPDHHHVYRLHVPSPLTASYSPASLASPSRARSVTCDRAPS